MLVEGLGLRAGKQATPLEVVLREVPVDRLARRVEKVGVQRSHLVSVDQEMRMPLQDCRHATLRFRVDLHEPITVEIEKIVVAASRGPQTAVLHGLVVGVGNLAGQMLKLTEVSALFHRGFAADQCG